MTKMEESKQSERPSLALTLPVEELHNAVEVVILQHPQEPDKVLGSAPLCVRSLRQAKLKVGLSWPSLSKAVGREAIPSEWAVLYLGGSEKTKEHTKEVNVLSKKLGPLSPEERDAIRGIIAIDGTWSQAKTLWWRNAWFLKLKRIVLKPRQKSLYGNLRKEPRGECLSTIESIALCLKELEKTPAIGEELEKNFAKMLDVFRANRKPKV